MAPPRLAITGSFEPAAWNRPARQADLDDLKGIVELVALRLGLGRPRYRAATDVPILHPGRSAYVDLGESLGGVVGELHPALVQELDLRTERVIVAELAVAGLEEGVRRPVRAEAPPRFPPSERDIAVVVSESTPAAAVEDAIRSAGGELLEDLHLFDVYRGAPLAPDEKSLAFRLVLQAPDRTLTEAGDRCGRGGHRRPDRAGPGRANPNIADRVRSGPVGDFGPVATGTLALLGLPGSVMPVCAIAGRRLVREVT